MGIRWAGQLTLGTQKVEIGRRMRSFSLGYMNPSKAKVEGLLVVTGNIKLTIRT